MTSVPRELVWKQIARKDAVKESTLLDSSLELIRDEDELFIRMILERKINSVMISPSSI